MSDEVDHGALLVDNEAALDVSPEAQLRQVELGRDHGGQHEQQPDGAQSGVSDEPGAECGGEHLQEARPELDSGAQSDSRVRLVGLVGLVRARERRAHGSRRR